MTLSYPSIVPTKYQGTYVDFNNVKVDRDGCNRTQYTEVTIPASTVITTVVGLVPFVKGARFCQGSSQLYIADLDTSTNVTFDIGYTYEDSANTSDDNAFASALTTAQTGGLITFDEFAGLDFVAAGNGWITLTVTGGSTTTAGAVKGQCVLCYDGASSVN